MLGNNFLKNVVLIVVCLLVGCSMNVTSMPAQSAGWNGTDIDALIRELNNEPDAQRRVSLLSRIGNQINRPTEDQVRALSGKLRMDRSEQVRSAVADLFASIAQHRQYRVITRRIPPEVALMLRALRDAYTGELDPGVRARIVTAAGQFNSSEAVVILNSAKGDINSGVRDAAVRAERARENRIRDGGF